MKINRKSLVKINDDVLTTLVDDELGMMNIEKGYYYTLNSVGKDIWDILENKMAVDEILTKLIGMYEVEKEVCYKELLEILEVMRTNGLIEVEYEQLVE